MKRNHYEKCIYTSPKISTLLIDLESGYAAGSNGELTLNNDSSSTLMENFNDNTQNLNEFTNEKWF